RLELGAEQHRREEARADHESASAGEPYGLARGADADRAVFAEGQQIADARAPEPGWCDDHFQTVLVHVLIAWHQAEVHTRGHREGAAGAERERSGGFGLVGQVVADRAIEQTDIGAFVRVARLEQVARKWVKVAGSKAQAEPRQRRGEARVVAQTSRTDVRIRLHADPRPVRT